MYTVRLITAIAIFCSFPVFADTHNLNYDKKIHLSMLFDEMSKGKTGESLAGKEFAKVPKLAAILRKPLQKGFVTKAELEESYRSYYYSVAYAFIEFDVDHNGYLTQLEVALKAPALSKRFNQLDANHDGVISMRELLGSRVVLEFSNLSVNAKFAATEEVTDGQIESMNEIVADSDTTSSLDSSMLRKTAGAVDCTANPNDCITVTGTPIIDDDSMYDPIDLITLDFPGDWAAFEAMSAAAKEAAVLAKARAIVAAVCQRPGESCSAYGQRAILTCIAQLGNLAGQVCGLAGNEMATACSIGDPMPQC